MLAPLLDIPNTLDKQKATQLTVDDWQIVNQGNTTQFVGYDALEVSDAKILKYRKVNTKGKEFYQAV